MIRILTFLIIVMVAQFGSQKTWAFGLKTHLWIGQSLWEDISDDCKLELGGIASKIDKELCEHIRLNRGAFLAGNLGPDVYPDFITGQVTTHPGVEGGWKTHNWLEYLVRESSSGEERAFAAGYLVHAASDTFAHTYVNAYAGDNFNLLDERAVELRHFALEKYIDSRLVSGVPDAEIMNVPTKFLRDKLVHSKVAAREARKSGSAPHVHAMSNVWFAVQDLEKQLEKLEREAGKGLATIITKTLDISADIASAETYLRGAETTLKLREKSLEVERRAFESASELFYEAVSEVEENNGLIVTAKARIEATRLAINSAENSLNSLSNSQSKFENELLDLRSRISRTARIGTKTVTRTVTDTVCHNGCIALPLSKLRKKCRRECRRTFNDTVEFVTDAWKTLDREITSAERNLSNLKRDINNTTTKIVADKARLATLLEEEAYAKGQSAILETTRASAETSFRLVKERFDLELKLTRKAEQEVKEFRKKIDRLQKELLDINKLKRTIEELVDKSNIISFHANNWRNSLEKAGEEYIFTSLQASK